ncbi:MAG: Na/Pi cotransporter family protein [Butyrivibrio sp.]|nr:Na/Pi cotransporter family protein [Butyrivibrio sp.]
MDFFNVLSLLGGLAFFLFGMKYMGDGLAKLTGGRMERTLERLTSGRIRAVALGAGVTAVIQSSSATTVMVVGFVNSGIMKLRQAVGVIFGANIGTTLTAWIFSLSGIDSGSFWVKMLKPSSFAPIVAVIGIIPVLFSKKDGKKDVGAIMVSFAVLMEGMEMMSGAVAPLKNSPEFARLFTLFSNPVAGMLAGAFLAALLQSSSASVGILQALCSTGAVAYSGVFPLILGQNIGTCVTALISSVGASKNARRAAFVHLYFNLIGTVVFMGLFYGVNAFVPFAFLDETAGELGIAVIHTVFNVFATAFLLPFAGLLERLACLTVREDKNSVSRTGEFKLLDSRFIEKPAFALEQCIRTAENMAREICVAVYEGISLLTDYDKDKAALVVEKEELADRFEDELGSYLVKLNAKGLSSQDSRTVSKLLHCIGDLERISDHSLNLKETADEMHGKGLKFSKQAAAELAVFTNAVKDIFAIAVQAFVNDDKQEAALVEPLEEVIDRLNDELKLRHIDRLKNGECTIELGFALSDITTNYERIADHCSNIAVCVLQMGEAGFEAHDYLDRMKSDDENFKRRYNEYKKKYVLPECD